MNRAFQLSLQLYTTLSSPSASSSSSYGGRSSRVIMDSSKVGKILHIYERGFIRRNNFPSGAECKESLGVEFIKSFQPFCGDLPYDIISEIFSWLPVKSLLEFKTVDRYMLYLITNPHFVREHLKRSRPLVICNGTGSGSNLFGYSVFPKSFSRYRGGLDDTSIAGLIDHGYDTSVVHVIGSANGLLCLAFHGHNFIFWNPATREFYVGCPCPMNNMNPMGAHVNFVAYGLGFEKDLGEYKIFRQSYTEVAGHVMEVCGLQNELWRNVIWENAIAGDYDSYGLLMNFPTLGANGVCVNNKVYFIAHCANGNRFPQNFRVVSIDIRFETCVVFPFPINPGIVHNSDMENHFILGATHDCLFASFITPHRIEVWMLQHASNWRIFLFFNIPVPAPQSYLPPCRMLLDDAFKEGGYFTMLISEKGEIYIRRIHIPSDCLKVEPLIPEVSFDGYCLSFGCTTYTPSLISL